MKIAIAFYLLLAVGLFQGIHAVTVETKVATEASPILLQTATNTETDTECSPDCLYKYPFVEGDSCGNSGTTTPEEETHNPSEEVLQEETPEEETPEEETPEEHVPEVPEEHVPEVPEEETPEEETPEEHVPQVPEEETPEEETPEEETPEEHVPQVPEEETPEEETPEEHVPHEEETQPTEECKGGFSVTSGTTEIEGRDVTYLRYNVCDKEIHHHVSYTYVLTNAYSGVFKNDQYDYSIYGAGALNFYNNYYGIKATASDKASCTCTCAYESFTFSYAFSL